MDRWTHATVALWLFLVLTAAFPHPTLADRPNVLFLVADDLNMSLGCYGHPLATPNVDRLADRGVRFDRAYCQYALCNPSRASFMTGLYPTQTGVHGNGPHFRERIPRVTTLPQSFRRAGYITARVGKVYHAGVPTDIGTPGQDDAPSWQERINPRGLDRNVGDRIRTVEPVLGRWLSIESDGREHTDGVGTTAAIHMMERYANDPRPFFLAVGFYRPHAPYVAPASYFEKVPPVAVDPPTVPEGDRDDLPTPAVQSIRGRFHDDDLSPKAKRTLIRAYYATVRLVDTQVGRLLDALGRLDLDNTIVVFMSDHGYHLGEHGWWRKATLFETSARVPLLVAGPGVERSGVATDAIVELVDLYPTLADLASVDAPAWLPGESLRPVLEDPSASIHDAALTQLGSDSFSIRTPRWRYTEWDGGDGGVELYDHRSDPGEHRNLAGDPAHRRTRQKLAKLLDRKLEAVAEAPDAVR